MATILVFDSGVGGLSVYQEIHQKLPHENYIYLFDNQAYPYGELDPDILIERVNTLILSLIQKHQIDLVVIACNTASTIVLPSLRKNLSIPVVGVVPAIKPAAQISNRAIALIATPATVKRDYTQKLIQEFSPQRTVHLLGSTRLVMLAEDKLRGKPVDLAELKLILEPVSEEIDVAVLGCTHFPLLKEEMQKVLGEGVVLIDSGKAIAKRVVSLLNKQSAPFQYDGQDQSVVSDLSNYSYPIYSSAAPWEDAALETSLKKLGFMSIKRLKFQGA